RTPAERPEQRNDECAYPEPAERSPLVTACSGGREQDDRRAGVFAVQMNPVATPVVLQNAAELRNDRVDQLFERHREARRELVSPAAGAWRPRHVFAHGQVLNGADHSAQYDGAKGQAEAAEGDVARKLPETLVV